MNQWRQLPSAKISGRLTSISSSGVAATSVAVAASAPMGFPHSARRSICAARVFRNILHREGESVHPALARAAGLAQNPPSIARTVRPHVESSNDRSARGTSPGRRARGASVLCTGPYQSDRRPHRLLGGHRPTDAIDRGTWFGFEVGATSGLTLEALDRGEVLRVSSIADVDALAVVDWHAFLKGLFALGRPTGAPLLRGSSSR